MRDTGLVYPADAGEQVDRVLSWAQVAAPSQRIAATGVADFLSIGPAVTTWTDDVPKRPVAGVEERLATLEARVNRAVEALARLTSIMEQGIESRERVVVLRAIAREDAKKEIVQLFRGGDVLDYGDIAEALRLDLATVVDICRELEDEGVIEACH